MKKPELAKGLACNWNSTVAEAADRLDLVAGEIVRQLKQSGQPHLPRIGVFTRNRDGRAAFQPEPRKHG